MTLQEKQRTYARVQLHALNPNPGHPVMIRGESAQAEFLNIVSECAIEGGASEVRILVSDPMEMAELIRCNDQEGIASLHEKTRQAFHWIGEQEGSVVRFSGSEYPNLRGELASEFPDAFRLWDQHETESIRFYREEIAGKGLLPWLVAFAPTKGEVSFMYPDDEDGLRKAWEDAFKMSLLDSEDPIAAWEALDTRLHRQCERLNNLSIDSVRITGHGSDMEIGFNPLHRYLGGSKVTQKGRRVNNNRPSYETWTAPDNRRADGVLCATVPFFCDGILVYDLVVTMRDGKIIEATATAGLEAFLEHIKYDGANRLGEFALVSCDSPLQGIPFTGSTLIEENRACHVAVGSAYKTNLEGGIHMTPEELASNGVNTSPKHTDFMWGGDETKIVARTIDGDEVLLMENGVLLPFLTE